MDSKYVILLSLLVFIGCGPSVTVRPERSGGYPPFPSNTPVDILSSDAVPTGWTRVGEAYFGDTGFTLTCGFDKMIELARQNARVIGANAFQIVEHKTPDLLSSCHRLKVVYYRRSDMSEGSNLAQEHSEVPTTNFDTMAVMVHQGKLDSSKPGNQTAFGYQIGGHTLAGINHEKRINSVLGVHFGGGLVGFGGGFRFHFGPETHSPFLDLNFKDGGFGLIETVALEYGGLWSMHGNSGIHYEIGIQKIVSIKSSFEDDLFKGKKTPPVIMAVGLGWGW